MRQAGRGEAPRGVSSGRGLRRAAGVSQIVRGRWASRGARKNVVSKAVVETAADLVYLKWLVESGAVKPVVDRRFPLESIAEAHAFVEGGQKKGNVVVTMDDRSPER